MGSYSSILDNSSEYSVTMSLGFPTAEMFCRYLLAFVGESFETFGFAVLSLLSPATLDHDVVCPLSHHTVGLFVHILCIAHTGCYCLDTICFVDEAL